MNFDLCIRAVKGRGVQVSTISDTGTPFWLPRGPPVTWAAEPVPGRQVRADLPRWLAQKHRQLVALRAQHNIAFHQPVELNPDLAKGQLPMSDFPADVGDGALFKNREKSKPSQPDYFGKAEIDGRKYRVSAWIKESKKSAGQKYMSLSFRLDEERSVSRPKQAAGARMDGEDIPFAPEVR